MVPTRTLQCLLAFAVILCIGISALPAQAESNEPPAQEILDPEVSSHREVEVPAEETYPNVRQPYTAAGQATARSTEPRDVEES